MFTQMVLSKSPSKREIAEAASYLQRSGADAPLKKLDKPNIVNIRELGKKFQYVFYLFQGTSMQK